MSFSVVSRMFRKATIAAFIATFASISQAATPGPSLVHDIVLRGGMIYDGSGNAPFPGEVAVDGDRIVYVGPARHLAAHREIDVHGQAIAPGFINMLAHPEESLLVDGRALSDLTQGVTLEVMGEFSMGPLNQTMKQKMLDREEVPEVQKHLFGMHASPLGILGAAPAGVLRRFAS